MLASLKRKKKIHSQPADLPYNQATYFLEEALILFYEYSHKRVSLIF